MKYLHELSRLREIPAPAGLKERTLQAIEQGKEVMDMKQLRRKTRRRIAAVVTAPVPALSSRSTRVRPWRSAWPISQLWARSCA